MRYVFGAMQLRTAAFAVIIIIIIGLVVIAGSVGTESANATTTTADQGHATCDDTFGGSCAFTGNGSATFSGEFDTPDVLIDPSLCPAQATDPGDTICGHFSINPSINGIVTSSIAFNPDNDLDLCAYNTEGVVLTCSTGTGGTEQVTFAVTGGRHYEVRILPISYPFPGPTPVDPATYTGAVSFTSGGGGEAVGLSTGGCCHRLEGGGKTASLTTADANFSAQIDDDSGQNGSFTSKQLKGKVRIASTGCDFRSRTIDSVTWDDANRKATINGHGRYKGSSTDVTFTATAQDNGDKNSFVPDAFTIDKCTNGGTVVKGQIKYIVDNH
jgi:hypothetical protein